MESIRFFNSKGKATKLAVFVWLYVMLSSNTFAQNIRLLSKFENIKMSIQKYEAESTIADFSEFHESTRDKFNINNYTWIQYETEDSSAVIILCFYKNVLYKKDIGFRYKKNQLPQCKEEWQNINSFILKYHHPIRAVQGNITNEAYGGNIGYSYTYYLNKPKTKDILVDVNYSARLKIEDSPYSVGYKFKASIEGYISSVEYTDLNNTDLDMEKGVSSVQIN